MIRKSSDGEEVKNSPKKVVDGRATGFEKGQESTDPGFEAWSLWAKAVEELDIDPADFIDPEEFGIRRPEGHSLRP